VFFSVIRRAIRDRKKAEADRDYWKVCADRLQKKLEERSDFFIEREMRLVDRFLTARVKTHAITDEIRTKALLGSETGEDHQLREYLAEKKQEMINFAVEAGEPPSRAVEDFERIKEHLIVDFQQDHSVM